MGRGVERDSAGDGLTVPPTSDGDKVAHRSALCPYLERGMKKTKTDWFPASVNPVRDGLYQTRVSKFGDVLWSVWMDGAWHYACVTAEVSVRKAEEGRMSFWQDRQWRGLTAPAK